MEGDAMPPPYDSVAALDQSQANVGGNEVRSRLYPDRYALLLLLLLLTNTGAKQATMPEQIHLAFGEADTEMVVTWSTFDATPTSTVEYGPAAGGEARGPRRALLGPLYTATGASKKFTDGGLLKHSQFIHTVTLKGLTQGGRYTYHVGDKNGGWSSLFSFTAKRAAFDTKNPLRILAYCDQGDINSQAMADVQEDVAQNDHDMVLHCGDIAYDMNKENGQVGDAYMRSIEPIAGYLPYMVAPGNHEEAYNFSHYRKRFSMPSAGPASESLFYSFDVGPAHIIAYNTEVFFWPKLFDQTHMKRQYEWLEADLKAANANRAAVPWIIVTGHRPMYCVVSTPPPVVMCNGEQEASRRGIPSGCDKTDAHLCSPLHGDSYEGYGKGPSWNIEDLLYQYGVDVAIYGHVHDYERYYPAYNLKAFMTPGITLGRYENPRATVHVTSGAGGNPEMHEGPEPPPGGTCQQDSPWCAVQWGYYPQGKQSADYSYSKIAIHNETHLHWRQWSSTLARVSDEFWIVQANHGPFGTVPITSGV